VIPYSADEHDEPVQVFPWINYGLIALNFLVFYHELTLGAQGTGALNRFILNYSLVPCEYTGHCAAYAGTPNPTWVTLFTSMFMHAGWAHILGNMLFLWVFGGPIERSMGHLRYVIFYLLCGLGASVLEIATAVNSNAPGLGASGAIAGVLGAYLMLYPTSKVRTLIPITIVFIAVRLPAWLLIAGWFLLQLIDGIDSLSPNAGNAATGGVAYWAHVGGFLTGAILIWFFRRPRHVAQLKAFHGRSAGRAG
jgi:membrane associated rhomboid family serine protease